MSIQLLSLFQNYQNIHWSTTFDIRNPYKMQPAIELSLFYNLDWL